MLGTNALNNVFTKLVLQLIALIARNSGDLTTIVSDHERIFASIPREACSARKIDFLWRHD